MFVGHYGVSFAAKKAEPSIPLWVLFIAVQLLDVLWAPFVLLGIEKVRIVPGITASNPLDLYYMPYTHSLLATIGWSVAAFLVYRLAVRNCALTHGRDRGRRRLFPLGSRLPRAPAGPAALRQHREGGPRLVEFAGDRLRAGSGSAVWRDAALLPAGHRATHGDARVRHDHAGDPGVRLLRSSSVI